MMIVLIAVIVVAGTFGELCIARAVRNIDNPTNLRSRHVFHTLWAAIRSPWMGLSIVFMAVGFFALLIALSIYGVSYIVPATALSYSVGGLGGMWFLGERVSRKRWIAIAVISVGVLIVLLSGPSN